MFNLALTILGFSSFAPFALSCLCQRYTLRDAYCGKSTGFLVQAEVVGKLGPFAQDGVSTGESLSVLRQMGYYRYILNIKEVYRGSIEPSSIQQLKATIAENLCGYELEFGKTYVLSGSLGDYGVMKTWLCAYHAKYDASFDAQMPDCDSPGSDEPSQSRDLESSESRDLDTREDGGYGGFGGY